MNDFNKRLLNLIRENNMTQGELARKIGATRPAVTRYVHGDRMPTCRILVKIAQTLGVSTDYLLGLKEKGD